LFTTPSPTHISTLSLHDALPISQFDHAASFYEGLAAVRLGQRWGFIDKNGDFVINPQYHEAGGFGNGLAPVKSADRWGFIDKKRSEEHTSELQSRFDLVCRLLLE